MSLKDRIDVMRVDRAEDRDLAVGVLATTYREEKGWVGDAETQLPASDLERDDVSWFLASIDKRPAGVLRVLYDPPLELYAEYGFDSSEGVDIESFVRAHKIAEVGRFAVVPEYRKFIVVVAALMRAASTETVERGYTHFITDVFEDDPHSPLNFHTRVMGFEPVATHATGELNCDSRRITLVLDLKSAYQRLRAKGTWIYRFLTEGWDDTLHGRLV
jgi:hypothetical protein